MNTIRIDFRIKEPEKIRIDFRIKESETIINFGVVKGL